MSELNDLESKSIYIIREAYAEFKKPAVLWSTGKDNCCALALPEGFLGQDSLPGDSYRYGL
jgi:sulfate adenylyltransferase subunit 2